MKPTMKKKLLSTALAAILSVSALSGTLLNADASYKIVPDGIPGEEWWIPDYINPERKIFIYKKNKRPQYKANIDRYFYDILVIPYDTYAKVYYRNGYYVKPSEKDVKHYCYGVDINNKTGKREGYFYDKDKDGKAFLAFAKSLDFKIGASSRSDYLSYNGDVNGDKEIDIIDAQMIINYVNGKQCLNNKQRFFADVNDDDKIDITDAVAVINHINGIKPIC